MSASSPISIPTDNLDPSQDLRTASDAPETDFVHDAVLLQETVAAVLGVKSLPNVDRAKHLSVSGIYAVSYTHLTLPTTPYV